jgi:hypothetical protein
MAATALAQRDIAGQAALAGLAAFFHLKPPPADQSPPEQAALDPSIPRLVFNPWAGIKLAMVRFAQGILPWQQVPLCLDALATGLRRHVLEGESLRFEITFATDPDFKDVFREKTLDIDALAVEILKSSEQLNFKGSGNDLLLWAADAMSEAADEVRNLPDPRTGEPGSLVGQLLLVSDQGAARFLVIDESSGQAAPCVIQDSASNLRKMVGKRVEVEGNLLRDKNGAPLHIIVSRAQLATAETPQPASPKRHDEQYFQAPSRNLRMTQTIDWIEAHKHEFAGMWVAVDDGRLVGQDENPKELYARMKRDGLMTPSVFIGYIEP